MRKFTITIAVAFVSVLTFTAICAGDFYVIPTVKKDFAPVGKTGQATCYNAAGEGIDCAGTGQDGSLRAGVGWPDPRFTDNGDGTVTDRLTGLS